MDKFSVYKYFNNFLKFALVAFGVADLIGFLPSYLDLADQLITSFILVYFWYQLNPSSFLLGKKSKTMDALILGSFYILFINTFLQVIKSYEILPVNQLSTILNFVSFGLGNLLMLSLILFFTFRWSYGKDSVIYSIFSFFSDEEGWNEVRGFESYKGLIAKFALTYFSFYFIAIYFFGLVIQWFIVSLDKSLIILAIAFAIKDLEKSKVKALQNIGEVDDIILDKITQLFTDASKFIYGFGFLIIFHYLSDIGTFFLPYLFGFELEKAYYSLGSNTHNNLIYLFGEETFTSFLSYISGLFTYFLSGFGAIFLILVPVIILFFISFDVKLEDWLSSFWSSIIISLGFTSSVIFYMAPWNFMRVIRSSEEGIVGVDFITQRVSESASLSFEVIALIGLVLLFFGLFSFNDKIKKYYITFIFLGSMFFLARYSFNYFVSVSNYYSGLILQYFGSYSSIVFSLNFSLFLLFDFLFYICGFLILSFYLSRYVIRNATEDLISNISVIFWTFVLISVPALVMYDLTIESLIFVSLIISVLFVFSLSLYRELTGEEKRDDFILGVTITIAVYQILLITITLLRDYFSTRFLDFLQPVIIFILSISAFKYFGFKYESRNILWKRVLSSILLGLVFGFWFYFIGEPYDISDFSVISLLVYTFLIAVSEELLFRLIIFMLAVKAFEENMAIILQGFVFASVHFINLKFLVSSYSNFSMLITYFVSLFIFGVVAALFTKGEEGNVWYAVYMHWITNFVTLLLI